LGIIGCLRISRPTLHALLSEAKDLALHVLARAGYGSRASAMREIKDRAMPLTKSGGSAWVANDP
jgi:hypothetical protein